MRPEQSVTIGKNKRDVVMSVASLSVVQMTCGARWVDQIINVHSNRCAKIKNLSGVGNEIMNLCFEVFRLFNPLCHGFQCKQSQVT
jgi:hypothetical protein